MSATRLLELLDESDPDDFANNIPEIRKIIKSNPTSADLQRAMTAFAIEHKLNPEQALRKAGEWQRQMVKFWDDLNGYSDFIAKKADKNDVSYDVVIDNLSLMNDFINRLLEAASSFSAGLDRKKGEKFDINDVHFVEPETKVDGTFGSMDAEQVLQSRIVACEEYKSKLKRKLDEIYGEDMGDPLDMKQASREKIEKITILGLTDPEFFDALRKYEIVSELQTIAEQKPSQEISSAKILADLDEKLEQRRYELCKFPDNGLVSFLKEWGGKVAMKLVSFIETLQQTFYTAPGNEFAAKIKLHAPESKSYIAQQKMFGTKPKQASGLPEPGGNEYSKGRRSSGGGH